MTKINRKIFYWLIVAGAVFSIITVFNFNHSLKTAQATSIAQKYGRDSKFTIPANMRGTWVSKSKRSAFKKIRLTAHTATFTAQASLYRSKNYSGKWLLYHMNNKWYSKHFLTSLGNKASKYSVQHRWLATRKDSSKQIFFKYGWTGDDEHSFMLRKTGSRKVLKFDNPSFSNNYYLQ